MTLGRSEQEVAAPLDLFGGAREGKANLAQPIDVHEQDSRTKRVLASMDETTSPAKPLFGHPSQAISFTGPITKK